jgi:hypothetical protein
MFFHAADVLDKSYKLHFIILISTSQNLDSHYVQTVNIFNMTDPVIIPWIVTHSSFNLHNHTTNNDIP